MSTDALLTVINSPFDPWDLSHRPDPKPFYAKMRQAAPVYRGIGPETGRSFWFVTRYRDVVDSLRNPLLGREWRKLPEEIREQHDLHLPEELEVVERHVLNLDPPDHTRLRRLVSHVFTSRRINDLEPRIKELTAQLLDEFGDGDDLIEKVALPVPVAVIAELLGIPIRDQAQFRSLVDRMLRPPSKEDGMEAGFAFLEYINDAIEQRRSEPGEDLLSALIHLEEEGDRLNHSEMLSMVQLLLLAGHETTVNLIGNGMLELMRHRSELERLLANPDLLGSAIEEILRFHGPVETTFPRVAYAHLEIAGVKIPEGDMVIPVLLSANNDPDQFHDPETFDITREPNRHLAFGSGIHYCLGAPLARLEASIVIAAFLDRWPKVEMAIDSLELEWTPDFFLRGVRKLPVRL